MRLSVRGAADGIGTSGFSVVGFLQYYLNELGNRVYMLKKLDPMGQQTCSAHPVRFSPDKYSRHQITIKRHFKSPQRRRPRGDQVTSLPGGSTWVPLCGRGRGGASAGPRPQGSALRPVTYFRVICRRGVFPLAAGEAKGAEPSGSGKSSCPGRGRGARLPPSLSLPTPPPPSSPSGTTAPSRLERGSGGGALSRTVAGAALWCARGGAPRAPGTGGLRESGRESRAAVLRRRGSPSVPCEPSKWGVDLPRPPLAPRP
eukprot:bmy_10381T0